MKRLLWVAVLLGVSGCSFTETPGLPELHFACSKTDDCASDYICAAGECKPKSACAAVEICDNGVDDTCDNLVDCEDPACGGKACNAVAGFQCGGSMTCTCGGLGGAPEPNGETLCGDGLDNDCNGKTDCADAACDGKGCGNSRTCQGGICVCPYGTDSVETSCGDGVDNDCDGKVDCADPDCQQKFCGDSSRPAAYCCSVASTGCKDLDRDSSNCGACGATCSGGRACLAVDDGAVHSGVCSCTSNNQCRALGQSCNSVTTATGATASGCTCASNSECASGATCDTTVGFCHY